MEESGGGGEYIGLYKSRDVRIGESRGKEGTRSKLTEITMVWRLQLLIAKKAVISGNILKMVHTLNV